MPNEVFWGDMLGVLKDISSYLEKQDATIERAKIDVPPKMQENPKPIKGGELPGTVFKPADNIAKEYVPMSEALDRTAGDLKAKEQTFLKEEEGMEEEAPIAEGEGEEEAPAEEAVEGEGEEEVSEEEDESMDELKSILKDIRNALVTQSRNAEVMKADLKKSVSEMVKKETDKMLRKQGFVPTRPDVQKIDVKKSYGVDTPEETTIKKSEDKVDMNKALDDMSKKSWTELGQLREKTQGFSPFIK